MKIRIYSDGGSRGNPGPSAAAAVLMNPENKKVLATVAEYVGETTNNQAEYYGVIMGLKKAKELGVKEVEVYMDSELAIKQLKGEYRVKNSELAKRFLEVHNLIQEFHQVTYQHVTRDKNQQADALVNKILDER
ncbi:ribonuclease HI family protein [Patescibacteria group bacterium]|nr:ribonuclease HI family protein [Patescibacteria group bacterium]MBU1705185.1 ribonuclease HI family protein [Patescibacteria group bacterium]